MASEAKASRRDNFPQSVINILFKRSGGKCCKCGATTFGPHTGRHDKYQNIGQAAHIAAAAPGGPRYDPKMAPEERMSAKNGLWLCSNCHSLIDRDTEAYPLKRLRQIKKVGEERARLEVGVATETPSFERVDETTDVLQAAISATTIVKIREVKGALLQLHGLKVSKNEAEEFLDRVSFINFEMDMYCPQVGTEMVAFFSKLATYCDDAEINLEVIRQFQFSLEAFNSYWSQQEVELVGNTLYAMTNTFRKGSKVYQSAVALLKDMIKSKSLRSKDLHSIPLELLKDIQKRRNKRGTDDVDLPTKKLRVRSDEVKSDHSMAMEKEDDDLTTEEGGVEFVDYINCMVELAEAGDEMTPQIESKVVEMGYEPNII